jgi:hypothetical protein
MWCLKVGLLPVYPLRQELAGEEARDVLLEIRGGEEVPHL